MNSIKIVTKLDFRALKYCNLFIMKYKRNMLLYTIILFVLPLIVIFLIFSVLNTTIPRR